MLQRKIWMLKEKFGINCASAEAQFGTGRWEISSLEAMRPQCEYCFLDTSRLQTSEKWDHWILFFRYSYTNYFDLNTQKEHFLTWYLVHAIKIEGTMFGDQAKTIDECDILNNWKILNNPICRVCETLFMTITLYSVISLNVFHNIPPVTGCA